ncbi:MAG: mismatch-specific DNA-glycosylase [Armatimonadetes bacterium]|nr:mismatch-specific DNA-glycosylase [Armatimonadota bacterium]
MLPDLLAPNLKVVICGTAAGPQSATLQQYYAGQGNKFWRTLFEICLTPRPIQPSEYEQLLSYAIGLTDLVKNKSGMDYNLSSTDFGSDVLVEKILKYKPKFLCFNGKRAGKEFLLNNYVDYGLQEEKIGVTRLFIAPSTSSAANGWWDINIWQELANYFNDIST